MKFREGDLVETFDGNLFDVKGLVHPPDKVVAFIRYTPHSEGERRRGKVAYRKVYPLHERYDLLREKFPQYLVNDKVFGELLCEVPVESIRLHYQPTAYLKALRQKRKKDELEDAALRFAQLLKNTAGVPWDSLGVSGSLLVNLHTASSDIDVIVYGSQNCYRAYETLKRLIAEEKSPVKSYNRNELKNLFGFRSKDTSMKFEDFVRTESRKVLQGKFEEHDYFVRCVTDWHEINEQYGSVLYRPAGYAKTRAVVTDDSQMIFTPCHYEIDDGEVVEGSKVKTIKEIVSFRGRFCEQARKGEFVKAQGKIESVQERGKKAFYRLLLGNNISDYMIIDEKVQRPSTLAQNILGHTLV
jgi:predicted nucleotidyltransferase